MSLVESVERIQKYSKSDLQGLKKSDLISLVLSSQFTIDTLKTSTNWHATERQYLKDEIRKKRKVLKTFDNFYCKLELNPHHISHKSYTEFDTKNFSVKNFIEMQQRKIFFQEQKIKDLQIKRLKRTICSDRSCAVEKSASMYRLNEEKSKILISKIENALKQPKFVLLNGKNYEIARTFVFNDQTINEHREICQQEVDLCYKNLASKYGNRVFSGIIAKRSKWDKDYKETFARNLELLERTKDCYVNNLKLIKTINGDDTQRFSEGKIVRSINFVCEKISIAIPKKICLVETLNRITEIDPDMIEVIINW
jgi:hypothetical protein